MILVERGMNMVEMNMKCIGLFMSVFNMSGSKQVNKCPGNII